MINIYFDNMPFHITTLDIIDIVLVAIILFQLYKLIRRTAAFSIFIGIFIIYLFWLIVKALNMELISALIQNEEKNKKIFKRLENEINEKELIKRKVTHIYVEIVCKAIAGKGLFDASHAISSVVLFLRPIIKHWRNSETYQDLNFQKIADVCLAMSYHDRKKDPKLLPFQIPDILKIMRITDELQEWDRESYSFIDDVRLCNDVSAVVSVEYKMKNRSVEEQCKGEITITDKILGILPLDQH